MNSPTASPRNAALVLVDRVVAVILLLIGLVFALSIFSFATSFSAFSSVCTGGPYEGLTCNSTVLAIATYGLIIVTVVGFALSLGFTIVAFLRRRLSFFWPIVGMVVILIAFYVAAFFAGQTVPAL